MPRDFILYILPFGLVRQRTFCLAHGLVRCNITAGVHTRGEAVSFRDVKIKIPDRKWNQGIWMTSRTGRVGWDLRKAVSWVLTSEEEGWLSEMGKARRLCALWAPCVGWVESRRCESSQHRKIVSRSPQVEKPLNSKVIKSFVPELTSCKVLHFRFPMSITHICVSWVCYMMLHVTWVI